MTVFSRTWCRRAWRQLRSLPSRCRYHAARAIHRPPGRGASRPQLITNKEEQAILGLRIRALPRKKYELRKEDLLLSGHGRKEFCGVLDRYLRDHSEGIPKIIHQIWLGPNKPPARWIDTWRKQYIDQHPDWTHMLWTEENLAEIDMLRPGSYFEEPTYNGKSDVVRYEVLYRHGGVYIDADSIWLETRSLSPLLERCPDTLFFLGQEPTTDYPASGVVAASRNHPALLLIINAQRENLKHSQETGAWITVGPLVLHVLENNHVPTTVFPSSFFYPEHWHGKTAIEITQELKDEYSASYMYQFGYTTNRLDRFEP